MSQIWWNSVLNHSAAFGALLLVSTSAFAAEEAPQTEVSPKLSAATAGEPELLHSPSNAPEVLLRLASTPGSDQTNAGVEQLEPSNSPAQTPNFTSAPDTESDPLAARKKDPMAQVTSVSQLSDVQPTDWAFQALQSLVERYGCIAGYPDGTFRGNRALTRYEFAAGLNACLDRINELIEAATEEVGIREDLVTVRRLQEEFAAELADITRRVDDLEIRTVAQEATEFSITTKLRGSASFFLRDTFAGDNIINNVNGRIADGDLPLTLQNSARLDFQASFSGKDRLRVRLSSSNTSTSFKSRRPQRRSVRRQIPQVEIPVEESIVTDEGLSDEEGEEILEEEEFVFSEAAEELLTQLEELESEIDELLTQIDDLLAQGEDESSPQVGALLARIDAIAADIDRLLAQADTTVLEELFADASEPQEQVEQSVSPGASPTSSGNSRTSSRSGDRSRSRPRERRKSTRFSLIDYRFPQGNAMINIFGIGGRHSLYADKITPSRSNPMYNLGGSSAGIGVTYKFSKAFKVDLGYMLKNASDLSTGLFDSNYSTLGQLVFSPNRNFKVGLSYFYTYNPDGKLRFGGAGTYLTDILRKRDVEIDDIEISSHSVGLEASYKLSRNVAIGGWLGFTRANIIGEGDADIWNYAVTLALSDLGKEGNLGLLSVGVEPTLKGLRLDDDNVPIPRRDEVFYVDASYKYELTDNISITSGLIWKPALFQNRGNDDVFLGTLKTTFSF